MLNTFRPSIPQGILGGHKFKSLGKLSNGWTDWHQMWYTCAYSSGNGYTPNKLSIDTQGGNLGGFRGPNIQKSRSCQTAGPIGTNFGSRLRIGTRLWIHLGMDIG